MTIAQRPRLRVLSVASEIYPLIKTGGLADVVGALPGALAGEGVEVRTLLPGYPAVLEALRERTMLARRENWFGGPARLLAGRAAGLDLLVLEARHLYARPGNPYSQPDGSDWPDNAQRFAALARMGAEIASGAASGFQPDIAHAHDWQAALLPAYLHYGPPARPPCVQTVHNLAFQGQFPRALLAPLGFPPEAWSVDGVEYYGTLGFLKAGLQFADRITTVSPTYAAEIRTSEQGMGLDGLLRARAGALTGILNGIDTTVWDPANDPHLAAPFDARRLKARAKNKAALQQRLGLALDPGALLFGVISRLSWQKGLDLLLASLPTLTGLGGQLALLGSGEGAMEAGFAAAAAAQPERIGCVFAYDEALAHLIQAGADAILVPSRFEPCGLTQLCALRYGAVPVVARVGGLADTVIDANPMALSAGTATGIQFSPVTGEALDAAIGRTVALWRQPALWAALQKNGLRTDVSWTRPAAAYADLYRDLIAERAAA
jgi:starch synthase